VIAPCHSGLTEYLNEENAMLVNYLEPSQAKGVYYGAGDYWPIDKDDLVIKMQTMVAHWDEEYFKVKHVSAGFCQQYTWQKVLQEFVDYMVYCKSR